jgi:hypothetical protein
VRIDPKSGEKASEQTRAAADKILQNATEGLSAITRVAAWVADTFVRR